MRFFSMLVALIVLALFGSTAKAQCGFGGANAFAFSGGYGIGAPLFSPFVAVQPSPFVFTPFVGGGFANVNVVNSGFGFNRGFGGFNRGFNRGFVGANAFGGGGGFANVNVVNQRGGLFGRRNSTIVNAQAGGAGGGVANVNVVNGRRGRR